METLITITYLAVKLIAVSAMLLLATTFLEMCICDGTANAVLKLPLKLGEAISRVLQIVVMLPVRIVMSLLGLLLQVIFSLLQIPITIVWESVPGLSKLFDEPKLKDLI